MCDRDLNDLNRISWNLVAIFMSFCMYQKICFNILIIKYKNWSEEDTETGQSTKLIGTWNEM